MIDMDNGIIVIGVKAHKIKAYEVWFIVEGKGLYSSLDVALMNGQEVAPCPVAVAEDGFYEILPQVLAK